ncbi:hypothetical protein [uncultured Duncaniella sp.]|jgi:hypothetical protein|uniref:hypothetical protein n=1 Tax=uncultured Duncaniella sp. TaxID=2768039 RepID=UPI00267613A8|nr:hypothetical protein [uncultured Duncaniella sp.]
MNKSIVTFLLLIGIIASSCTTSKSVVSQNANLSKYEYASIINNDTYHIPAQLMEHEIQLFDAIEESRLKLINHMRIGELTPTQQSKLLMVKYGVDVSDEQSVVTVNFIDYLTGRPIASCQGTYTTLGFDVDADIRGAIKSVAKQIAETFPKE